MAGNVVSFSFSWCSTGGPEATLLGDGFLYGILSASSPDFNSSGPKGPFGLMWLSLSHLVYNSVRFSTLLQLELELISLWVYHGNFFSSSHFISQFAPTRFPLITAIRMCHLLPVHHLGMAFLAWSKGQNTTHLL